MKRRGGNASALLDPLGWRVHHGAWPVVWLARKFRPGSWLNLALYAAYDRIVWRRVTRRLGGAPPRT